MLVLLAVISCKKDVYYTLEVSCNPSEGGTVSLSSELFPEGETVTIKATPSAEYLFEGWNGDASGSSNPLSVVMDSDKSIIANFVKKTYSLAIEVEGNGHVEERLMGTKSDYESGSIVELTAMPDEYWRFDHWEGDVVGSDNPKTIEVTSAKSVKAVFVKPQYSFNVKIVGPGVVDEYLVETKSGLDAGTQVLLRAIPSDGALFKGWSGSLSSTKSEIEIAINENTEVVAKFAPDLKQYPIPNLKTPSRCFQRVFPDLASDIIGATPTHTVYVDYNLDGYMDAVTFNTLWTISDRLPVGFYQGDPYKIWKVDEQNNNVLPGLIDSRKGIYGDYNNDGFPDMCLIGGGYDGPESSGDYPVLLFSNGESAKYSETIIPECLGYWHGGTSGDYDNDGDLDIFLIDGGQGIILINDGNGIFLPDISVVPQKLCEQMYNTELFDINHDGFLDLFIGGHDHHKYKDNNMYVNMPVVLWGNGDSFSETNYTRLPMTPVAGMGITNDFYFYDIDDDGNEELLLIKTSDEEGDPLRPVFYEGWCFQILKLNGYEFEDITQKVMGLDNCYSYAGRWFAWMEILETENGVILYGQDFDGVISPMFELDNGMFMPYHHNPVQRTFAGMCIYSDGVQGTDDYINLGCEESYSGETCICWKVKEPWQSWTYYFSENVNLKDIVKEGYEFEFYVKCSNPNIKLCAQFENSYSGENWKGYGHGFDLDNVSDGEWHRIHVPLSEFYAMGDGPDWEDISHMYLWVTSEDTNGEIFYLDEIRIRKIVDFE